MSEAEEPAAAGAKVTVGRRGGTRRVLGTGIIVVAALVAAVWGISRWRYARTHVSTDNAQVDAHIVPVLAKVGGYVAEVLVEENQLVHRGETLVVIDDAELRVRVAEAEADLAAARAAVGTEETQGQVEAEVAAARARREALEARLASAQAALDRTRSDLARIEELAAKKISSVQQLDAARAAAEAAEAEVSAVQ
ncbi:MAG TPA: biotin/lipoyl-binding protein, partial [Longimicrobiales bacterium]|nr:biotin/lipoyl-binding protein [Longimicrobiales bacterium]